MNAFDELQFGPQRILNLRESLPTAAEATRRSEAWLREQQLKGIREVLIITGRGNRSVGGVPVLKGAIEKLLFSLRRRGVVTGHHEHNPGAFAVTMAPIRSLVDAPPRRGERQRPAAAFEFHGLAPETITLLRELAGCSLADLGVIADDTRLRDEMHRQLASLAPRMPPGDEMEEQLRRTLQAALAEYD